MQRSNFTIRRIVHDCVCVTIKLDLISTICYSRKLCSSICTKKNSGLFLLCAINKYASVRLHRLRLLRVNSPSGATKRSIYLYIYIFLTMFKDHAGVCASARSLHLITTSRLFFFSFSSTPTGHWNASVNYHQQLGLWRVITSVIITDLVRCQARISFINNRRGRAHGFRHQGHFFDIKMSSTIMTVCGAQQQQVGMINATQWQQATHNYNQQFLQRGSCQFTVCVCAWLCIIISKLQCFCVHVMELFFVFQWALFACLQCESSSETWALFSALLLLVFDENWSAFLHYSLLRAFSLWVVLRF